ncbi:MAG: hypothetical protein WD851_02100 [Pirellulales bacterium]
MRQSIIIVALAMLQLFSATATEVRAQLLLAVDFGEGVEDPVQPGFLELTGAGSQATANAVFGTYTVDLAGQGFADSNNGSGLDASVRPLYRDYYYHNSDVNGVGVTLAIGGVTPNQSYNLTLWSYDADQFFSSTPTAWEPTGGSTGTSGSITNFATPKPTTLSDYSTTIQVMSATNTLEVFGTTTSGFGGTRLNAFRLNDGASDVLSVDFGTPSLPPSATQAGYVGISGLQIQSSAAQAIGAYVVTVEGQGFENTSDGNANDIDPSIRDLHRDTYYNNSDVNGVGVTLKIEGVTPNTDYDVKLWSYDPAQFFSSTETVWGPDADTTGSTGTITNFASPRPMTLEDRSTIIRVHSTSDTLTIFGTTTSGFGGTRLNAFELHAVVPEPSLVAFIACGLLIGVACLGKTRPRTKLAIHVLS